MDAVDTEGMTRRSKSTLAFVLLLSAVVAAILTGTRFAVAQQPTNLSESIGFEWDANSETDLASYLVTITGADGAVTKSVPASETSAVWNPIPSIRPPWTVMVQAVNKLGFISEPSKPLVLRAPIAPAGLRVRVVVTISGEVPMRSVGANADGSEWRLVP
jgi:hypothetical protein